jgi:iron complex outermembrane receptor protein
MWLDARFSDNNDPEVAGNRPASVPEIAATLWGEYRFTKGKYKNFGLNGGVFYEGQRYGDDQNTFTLDPYTRIDVGTAYYYPLKEKELAIRLNIENINDVTYFYANSRTNVTVGAPRSVWLTFEVR